MNIPNYSTFDPSTNQLVLLDNYLMAISYSDGFTDRLLHVDILIDDTFTLTAYFNSFELKRTSKQKGFCVTYAFEEMPEEIRMFLESMMNMNTIPLKDLYDVKEFAMSSSSSYTYLFNIEPKTKRVFIDRIIELSAYYFPSEYEQEFLKFHICIENWIENTYEAKIASFKK